MGVDEIQIAAGSEPRQHIARQSPQPIAVDVHEPAERQPLSRAQHELRLRRFQEIKVAEPPAEGPRRLELRLIGLQEAEHILQVLRAFASGVEQTLAEAFAVHAGKVFVDAQIECVLVFSREHERIAAHEGPDILAFQAPASST